MASGGLDRLAADLRTAGAGAREKARTVVVKVAYDIERDAKTLAPVDTGNLRNSIGVDLDIRLDADTIAADIGPTANYGLYLEEGTSRMSPQPYMRPAMDRNAPGFEAAMGQIGGIV